MDMYHVCSIPYSYPNFSLDHKYHSYPPLQITPGEKPSLDSDAAFVFATIVDVAGELHYVLREFRWAPMAPGPQLRLPCSEMKSSGKDTGK